MKKKIIVRSDTTNKKICSFKIESKFFDQIQIAANQQNISVEDFIIKSLREYVLKSYIERK